MSKTRHTARSAAADRHRAFAAAYMRLGTAAAAYREVYPSSKAWSAASVASRAADLMRLPAVAAAVEQMRADSRLDAIASRHEIASVLAEIMRGNLMQTAVARVRKSDGSQDAVTIEVPPPLAQRIRAAKELERMLPSVIPSESHVDAAEREASSTLSDRLAEIRKRRQEQKGNE